MDFSDLVTGKEKENLKTPGKEKEAPETEPKRAYAAVIDSKLLNEKIIILKDRKKLKETRAEYPGVVIYLPDEIKILSKFKGDPESIKLIHNIKKKFEGWIY